MEYITCIRKFHPARYFILGTFHPEGKVHHAGHFILGDIPFRGDIDPQLRTFHFEGTFHPVDISSSGTFHPEAHFKLGGNSIKAKVDI